MAAKWFWTGSLLLLANFAQAFPVIERWQTENGVPVALVERHGLPIIDLQIDIDAGESRAPVDQPGVATLAISGLLDNAPKEYELVTPYERLTNSGTEYGYEAGRDRAVLRLRMVSQNNPATIIATFAEQLAEPSYPYPTFKYRRDWLAGQFTNQPEQASAERALALVLYGKQPLGIIDRRTSESIESLGNSDARKFHRRYFVPGNMRITLVGALTRQQAESFANTLTRHLPQGSAVGAPPAMTLSTSNDAVAPLHVIRHKNQSQIELAMLLPLNRKSDDLAAIVLANYMLGGAGFESRLMRELREKRGLTYSVSSALDIQRGGTQLSIEVATRNEEAKATLNLLRAELERFTRDGPSDEEVAEARDRYLRGMKFWGNTNASLLSLVANLGYHQLPDDYYDRFAAQIAGLNAAQIKAAWQRHVDPVRFVVAIEGPPPKAAEDKPAPKAEQAAEPASDKADAS